MSKFYQEDSSDLESEEDQQVEENVVKAKKGFDSDSEGEEKRRVVRSLKEKLYLEMKEEIKKCKAKLDIEDFSKVTDSMEALMKVQERTQKSNIPANPKFFIRHLVLVSTVLENISPESKKKFNTLNSKAFTKLRQRIKKWKEPLEKEIEEFMKNPTFEDTEESESEEEKLDQKDYYSSSSDEEDEEMKMMKNDNYRRKLKREDRRKYWLKPIDFTEGAEKEEGKKKKEKKRKEGPSKRQARTEKVVFNIERSADTSIVEDFETTEKVNEFLQKVVVERTHMDVEEIKRTVSILETLLQVMKVETEQMEAEKKIEILLVLIAIRGDIGKIEKTQYSDKETRLLILRDIKRLFELIKKGNFEQISTFYSDQNVLEAKEVSEAFFSYLKNADSEWLMAMRLSDQRATVDANAPTYLEHLRDHGVILALERAAYNFFVSKKEEDISTSLAFKILEQMYYIPDDMLRQMADNYEAPEGFADLENPYRFGRDGSTKDFVYELATTVYQHADAKIQVNTVLLHSFNHATNDRYYEAKDLLLMSKIAENIKNYTSITQSLYNRTIVRIGLCAFRLGKLKECEDWLEHVCQYNKLRDLVSQNPQIRNEKEERRRYTPPHMHFSLDMVETVYFISVVLLETPYFFEENRVNLNAIRSKSFKKEWEKYEKQLFHGPPENNKEVLIEASKKLWKGDWRNCSKMIEGLDIWNKISYGRDQVKERLLVRIKEQAFKCFLFRYKDSLEALDFGNLSTIFELSAPELKTLTARVTSKEPLQAHN